MPVEDSLTADARMPSSMAGLEAFTFGDADKTAEETAAESAIKDADSLFNLPDSDASEDEEA
jgi:hypothetical protein